jgi:hypothetical protein
MFLKIRKSSTLAFLSPILLVSLGLAVEVRGQRAGSNAPSMGDQARAIQRADLDRLLISSLPARTDSKSNRAEVLKQIRMDFKELQEVNNKMMAATWARESLDYSFLSDMISRIKEKANRLKMNLDLPAPDDIQEAASARPISSSGEFRTALRMLDQTIQRFVNNPIFQSANTVEIDRAAKARHDLESIILMSNDLKKTASRLGKSAPAH